MKVGIQNKVFEGFSVLERFKYLSIKLILEVYFTFGPIAETKPQFVIRYVAGFFNSDHHYSKGGDGFQWFSLSSRFPIILQFHCVVRTIPIPIVARALEIHQSQCQYRLQR